MVTTLRTLAQSYLAAAGKERDAAALLLARLLTRPDVVQPHLGEFAAWAETAIAQRQVLLTASVLSAVAAVLKHAPQRTDVLPMADAALRLASGDPVLALAASNSMVCKMRIKVRPADSVSTRQVAGCQRGVPAP